MKQPKDDNRPNISKQSGITHDQHIVPAKIIKKWKQDGNLLTKIKNNPKLQKISNERNKKGLFSVYHRWTKNVENLKTNIENKFHKIVSEYEQQPFNLIIDDRAQKEQEIILNYFNTIMTCNYFKYKENSSYVKLNLSLSNEQERQRQQQIRQQEKEGFDREYFEKIGIGHLDGDGKTDVSHGIFLVNVYPRTHFYVYENKNNPKAIWFYIKTKERLYLPDCYKPYEEMDNETVGIINVSPHGILISQHFINTYLSRIAEINNFDLSQLDINNTPADCKKVISFVKIINEIASRSYDKWLIL